MRFSSVVLPVGKLPQFTEKEIRDEPMLFAVDRDFAKKHGGPITRAFLESVDPGRNWVIDSRTHMLMAGWYPCIPGWHLDDVPRSRPDGQPDHETPAYRAEHVMAVVGDTAMPEFALGEIELDDPAPGRGATYGLWHPIVDSTLTVRLTAEPGRVYRFDWQAFHRGLPADKFAWRFFIRATTNTMRPVANEIRKQVQAYLPAVNGGW